MFPSYGALFIHNHIPSDLTKSLLRVSHCSFSLSQMVPSHSQIPHRSQTPLRTILPAHETVFSQICNSFHPVPPMTRENHHICFPFHPRDLLGGVWGSEEGLGPGWELAQAVTCVLSKHDDMSLHHQYPLKSQVRWCMSLSPALGRLQWEDPQSFLAS